MELVIDTNKILSAIIRPGIVRKIVIFSGITFYSPESMVKELISHKNRICRKLGITEKVFNYIWKNIVFPNIVLVSEEKFSDKIRSAYNIAKTFDEKDTPFIALSLKLGIPIWTNDRDIIVNSLKTGKYIALDTKAVIDLIKGVKIKEVLEDLRRRYGDFFKTTTKNSFLA